MLFVRLLFRVLTTSENVWSQSPVKKSVTYPDGSVHFSAHFNELHGYIVAVHLNTEQA